MGIMDFSKTLSQPFYLAVIQFIVPFQITISLACRMDICMQVEASVTENLHKDVKTVVICDTELNFD